MDGKPDRAGDRREPARFFRPDYNTDPGVGIKTVREGFIENGYWRYYEALYGIYDGLRARVPNVIPLLLRGIAS
jgi:hypothetical protein